MITKSASSKGVILPDQEVNLPDEAAKIFLDAGYAVLVGDSKSETDDTSGEEASSEPLNLLELEKPIASMDAAELKAFAKLAGVKAISTKNKEQLKQDLMELGYELEDKN
jgi:hypothetical protein